MRKFMQQGVGIYRESRRRIPINSGTELDKRSHLRHHHIIRFILSADL